MNELKKKLAEKFWAPQTRKWMRTIDALIPVYCFIGSLAAIYLTKDHSDTESGKALVYIFAWVYVVITPVLSILLYRKSDLKILERTVITIFILISTIIVLLFSMELNT